MRGAACAGKSEDARTKRSGVCSNAVAISSSCAAAVSSQAVCAAAHPPPKPESGSEAGAAPLARVAAWERVDATETRAF